MSRTEKVVTWTRIRGWGWLKIFIMCEYSLGKALARFTKAKARQSMGEIKGWANSSVGKKFVPSIIPQNPHFKIKKRNQEV